MGIPLVSHLPWLVAMVAKFFMCEGKVDKFYFLLLKFFFFTTMVNNTKCKNATSSNRMIVNCVINFYV